MNATLNPEVLRWARHKAGLSEHDLAEKVGVRHALVKEWETSGSIPFNLVEKLAEKTRTAFGFLFLKEPPQPKLPIADFRRIEDTGRMSPSEELLEAIHGAQLKQSWYRDYLISNDGKPLSFVGKFSVKTPVEETAEDIRATLKIGPRLLAPAKKWEEAIRYTTEAVEDGGILVLRAGYVGYTGRGLSVDEFRGFAISDAFAPLIFINGADAQAAQIFTIAHEIAHIWIGETGVSNLEKTYSTGGAIEKYCNAVAAEVLLPLSEIRSCWDGDLEYSGEIERLSHKYKISRIVVARRAKDAGLLSEENFASYYKLIAGQKRDSSKGVYYITEKYQNSRRFSIAIIQEALAGRASQRDAMQMLGIKKDTTFRKYARSLQGGVAWPIF